jgi:hypothetical protein
MTTPYEPPEPAESKDAEHILGIPIIAYKIGGIILIVLLLFWVWRMYRRLPPAQPAQYPAVYVA